MTEFGLILGAGLLALAIAAFLARPLLSRANRLRSATALVGTLAAGARSCLRLHGRAIAVLASPIAFAAFVAIAFVRPHAPSDPVPSNYEHAAWVTLSLLFGVVSALLAAHLSTQVSVRGASHVHTALRDGDVGILRAAIGAGAVASLATNATLLLGLAVLCIAAFGASGGFADTSSAAPFAMARLVSAYGVGAALGSLVAHLQSGAFVATTRALAQMAGASSAQRPHPTTIAAMLGRHLDLGTGRTSDAHSTLATGTVVAMVLCSTIVQSNPDAFRTSSAVVLMPLLAGAFSVLGSTVGMLVVRTDGVERLNLVLDRGLAVTVVLALATFAGLSRWLLADHWLGAFGAAAAGVGAFVAVVILLRITAGADSAGSRNDPLELASLSGRGLLHAAWTTLIALVAAGTGFACGRITGLQQGGELGLVFVLLGFLASSPYILATAALGSVVHGTLGMARSDLGRARVAVRAERWAAAADDALLLARGTAPVGSALVAWTGVAAVSRLAGGMMAGEVSALPSESWAVAAGAAVLGISLLFWMSASALGSVHRTVRAMAEWVHGSIDDDGDVSRSRDPAVLTAELLQETVRQSVPRVLLAVSLPVVGWMVVRMLAGAGPVTLVATCCALATASAAGLGLSATSEGSRAASDGNLSQIGAAEASVDKTAVDESTKPTKNPSHGVAVVGNTLGSPLRVIVGPCIHALVKLLAAGAVALAPLFI